MTQPDASTPPNPDAVDPTPTPEPTLTPETALEPPPPLEAPAPLAAEDSSTTLPPKRRRSGRAGWIVAVSLLSVALLAVSGYLAYALMRFQDAVDHIEELDEIIDTKESFSAAMSDLVATTTAFDGLKVGDLVSDSRIESLAARGWAERREPRLVEFAIEAVEAENAKLTAILDAAEAEKTSNASGSSMETIIDELGAGFVTTAVDDADALCESDVLGCVMGDDPYTVHFDAADTSLPYMTEWLWAGIAYHEFAHVLQMTNFEETEAALEAYGGDSESMADCFALTYLDGWELDHRIWVSSYEYWDVSIGYGYTCDEAQRQVVRDWYEQVGYQAREF